MQEYRAAGAGFSTSAMGNNGSATRIPMKALRTAAAVSPIVSFTANRLLSSLPASSLTRLRPHLKEVALSKEQYLFQQDERIDAIYFPETAVISEYQILEDGRTIEVSITGRDSAIGIPSAFGSRRAINCSQVCIGGKALRIQSDLLEKELSICEEIQRPLQDTIVRQMKHLSQKVICNTFHSVEQRFCTWLLMLSDLSGMNALRITHEHAARVLGVHRPSITCIAQGLRDRGLIEYSRARIMIRDRPGVEKNACVCYIESAAVEADVWKNIPRM
jgi:CRP-like cAMP-binding protein